MRRSLNIKGALKRNCSQSSVRGIAHATTISTPSTSPFAPRHFLSIGDLSPSELASLVSHAHNAKQAIKHQKQYEHKDSLKSKTVALLFSKRSTRTRVSTETAVQYLGGHPMFLGKDDIQLGVNESPYDTSRVISSMVSCIVARVDAHEEIASIAKASTVPVINGLSEAFHPLQVIADILTIKEAFGKTEGLRLAWVGDANNVLNDLAMACAKSGIHVTIATPQSCPMDPEMLELARTAGDDAGVVIQTGHDPLNAVKGAHVIVTDTWVSMGHESEKSQRLKDFEGFKVTMNMAHEGGAHEDWRFMHCLPRKPEEVSDEVFYSPKSLVFEEAENRVYAAIAVLERFVVQNGNFESN